MESLNIDLFIACMEANNVGYDVTYTYSKRMSTLHISRECDEATVLIIHDENDFKHAINEVSELLKNTNK